MNRVFNTNNWCGYARSFLSVMPSEMLALNKTAASRMHGEVADFGCGAGKLIPFVLAQTGVNSYTGVDLAAEMVEYAARVSERFARNANCRIIHGDIASVKLDPMDSAVSINSYYTWPEPEKLLRHIRAQLKENAVFVLATLNPSINMPKLLAEAEMELFAHPHWNEFKQFNLEICGIEHFNYIEIDELVAQARDCGFRLREAHTKFYGGGLNFLVLNT